MTLYILLFLASMFFFLGLIGALNCISLIKLGEGVIEKLSASVFLIFTAAIMVGGGIGDAYLLIYHSYFQ